MKRTFGNQFVIIFSLLIFNILSCCDDDSPTINCNNGYEVNNGSCKCPEGKFSAYGFCRELANDEWYGVLSGCSCPDTLFFKINKIVGNTANISLNDGVIVDFPNPGSGLNAGFDMQYYQFSNGDSLAPIGLPYGSLICNADHFWPCRVSGCALW